MQAFAANSMVPLKVKLSSRLRHPNRVRSSSATEGYLSAVSSRRKDLGEGKGKRRLPGVYLTSVSLATLFFSLKPRSGSALVPAIVETRTVIFVGIIEVCSTLSGWHYLLRWRRGEAELGSGVFVAVYFLTIETTIKYLLNTRPR
jgi:hypothetical protein